MDVQCSFKGPGGVGRGLGSAFPPKSVHGSFAPVAPALPPDYFSLAVAPLKSSAGAVRCPRASIIAKAAAAGQRMRIRRCW